MQNMIREFTTIGIAVDFMKFGKLIEKCCKAPDLAADDTIMVKHHGSDGKNRNKLIKIMSVGGAFSVTMYLYPLKEKKK